MLQKEIVIVGGARTPMAEYAGTPGAGKLKDFSACELGAIAGKAALERARAKPEWIDHVVMGLANHDAVDALYGARDVCLRIEGMPIETPALTVNRICGSGAQAIVNGAQMILLDEADFVLAGGMESMSQTPYAVRGIRGTPIRFGPGVMLEDVLFQSLNHPLIGMFMAQTAEKLARRYGITREDSDRFAYESQMRAKVALEKKLFEEERVAVEVVDRKGNVTVVNEDDHCRPDTTLEALAKLRPAFGRDGLVTAGNASGIVDGGAAVVVTTMEKAEEHGLTPLARLVSWGIAGVDPTIMGIGPAPASRKALEKAGLTQDDIDLWEINEAFAPQYLAVEKELELDRSKVNVNGGAIALGHPLGATGCILTLKLIMELHRRKGRYGISTMCIGGGQGIALLVEAL
ncbi:MAG: thiolase family protein [bacterium]